MCSMDEVTIGIAKWIKSEVIPVLPSYAGFLLGGLLIHNAGHLKDMLNGLGTIGQTLDIYNTDGCVDVDKWASDLKQSMREFYGGNLVVNIAGMKSLTFHEADIDCAKRFIKGEL